MKTPLNVRTLSQAKEIETLQQALNDLISDYNDRRASNYLTVKAVNDTLDSLKMKAKKS